MRALGGVPVFAAAAAVALLTASPAWSQASRPGFFHRSIEVSGVIYRYQVYVPIEYRPERRWPVILFLHGAGERGSDGARQTQVGLGPVLRSQPDRYPALVVFPQAPERESWVGPAGEAAMAALEQTLREYSTDRSRVYVTGFSMGGQGAWYLASTYPDRFSAALVVAGFISRHGEFPGFVPADSGPAARLVARRVQHVAVWVFHGDADAVVPVAASREIVGVLQDQGSRVRYTELPGVGHNSWDRAYGSAAAAWLLEQRRPTAIVAQESGGIVRIVSRGEQRGLRPRLSVMLGPYAMSTTYQATSVSTNRIHGGNLFAGASVAMGVSRKVSFEAEYRSVLDSDWTFRTLGFGVVARTAQRSGLYARLGVVRIVGREPQSCDGGSCPGSGGEARGGVEAALGMELSLTNHLAGGPRLSWTQSIGTTPRYRLMGIGLHLSVF